MVLEEISSDHDISQVVTKILDSVSQPVTVEGRQVSVGSSIGISFYPVDGRDADELIKNADAAMYKAKMQGVNTFCFCSAPAAIPR